MEFVTVGRTGVQVSRLCLGTMSFGNYSDPATSRAMFARPASTVSIFFDCANSYAGGKAEVILGDCIAETKSRDDIVLVSKVCRPMNPGVNGRGLSRKHIMQEVEASLSPPETDRIDFYFVHHYDR